MGELKQRVVKGVLWQLLEKFGCQVMTFVVGMVLARLLSPSEFGTVALTGIFFAVTGVLVDSGLGNALVQKKDSDDLDFNSVFYLNLALSTLAYVALFFAAPWIADFYRTPELTPIVRVSAVCFFYNAVNAIQNAELQKKMLFNLSFRISLITCFTSGFFGILFAFLGFGVWALVWASVLAGTACVIARWFFVAWRPKLMFSWTRLKPLYSFGWKMAASALLDKFFAELNGLLIGRFYTKAEVAFVNKGNATPNMAMSAVDGTLGAVSFPALVQFQDDRERLREAMRKMIRCSTFLVFPLMTGVALCSRSWIRLTYGEPWLPAVPYMMLACFSFALWPFHTVNLRGIIVMGRSDVFLKLEVVKKALKLVAIFAAFRYGVLAFMIVCTFVLDPLCVFVNAWPNRKLLGYAFSMQVRDVLPSVWACCPMVASVWAAGCGCDLIGGHLGVGTQGTSLIVFLLCRIGVQALVGAGVYFGVAYAARLRPLGELLDAVDPLLRKKVPALSTLFRRRFSS